MIRIPALVLMMTALLALLRWQGAVAFSWVWVFGPIWIPALFGAAVATLALIVVCLGSAFEHAVEALMKTAGK